jgi:hypothetical protein
MKCANEECSNDAEKGSNYCDDHQFTLTSTGRVSEEVSKSTGHSSSSEDAAERGYEDNYDTDGKED